MMSPYKLTLRRLVWSETGNQVELPCALGLLGILAAILIPYPLMAKYYLSSAQCVTNLIRMAAEPATSKSVCPLSDEAYRFVQKEGELVLSCPNPDEHHAHFPRLRIRNDSFALDAGLGDFDLQIREPVQLITKKYVTLLDDSPETLRIGFHGRGIYRWLLAPLGVVVCGVIGAALIRIAWELFKECNSWTIRIVASIFAVPCFFLGIGYLVLGWQSLNYTTRATEITLQQNDRNLTIEDHYLGGLWTTSKEIVDAKAVYPFWAADVRAVLIYEEDGSPEYRTLFRVSRDDANIITTVNKMLQSAHRSGE